MLLIESLLRTEKSSLGNRDRVAPSYDQNYLNYHMLQMSRQFNQYQQLVNHLACLQEKEVYAKLVGGKTKSSILCVIARLSPV